MVKNYVAAGLIGLGALVSNKADGALVSINNPIHNSSEYGLTFSATNNDSGVYNTASTQIYSTLASQIASLNSVSIPTIMSGWNYGILGSPDGEVYDGWSMIPQSNGTISYTNNGTLADFTFTTWQNSSSNSSQDKMASTVDIPTNQLESNSVSGYQPFTLADVQSPSWNPYAHDAIIVLSDSPLLSVPNHRSPRPPEFMEEAFVGTQNIDNSWSTPGRYYVLLTPGDFAEWTDFGSEHGSLDPAGDANGDGRSNFLDYASGQDPEAAGLLPIVGLEGGTLTLRRRINGSDAAAVAEYSDDLLTWHALVEGVHYTVAGETVTGEMRTLVLQLAPGQPTKRFYRQRFGP